MKNPEADLGEEPGNDHFPLPPPHLPYFETKLKPDGPKKKN